MKYDKKMLPPAWSLPLRLSYHCILAGTLDRKLSSAACLSYSHTHSNVLADTYLIWRSIPSTAERSVTINWERSGCFAASIYEFMEHTMTVYNCMSGDYNDLLVQQKCLKSEILWKLWNADSTDVAKQTTKTKREIHYEMFCMKKQHNYCTASIY